MEYFFTFLEKRCNKILHGKYANLKMAIVAFLIATTFSYMPVSHYWGENGFYKKIAMKALGENISAYDIHNVTMFRDLLYQSEHIFEDLSFMGEKSAAANKFYRIFPPLLIRYFHLNLYSFGLLQLSLNLLFLVVAFRLSKKILVDKFSTFLFITGFYSLLCSQTFFVAPLSSYIESFTYLFLLLIFTIQYNTIQYNTIQKLSIILLLFAGFWTDERFFINSFWLWIFDFFHRQRLSLSLKNISNYIRNNFAILIVYPLYLLLRLYFGHLYPHKLATDIGALETYQYTMNHYSFMLSYILEGFLIVLIIGITTLIYSQDKVQKHLGLMSLAMLVGSFIVALSIRDYFKSIMYCFPLLFICLIYLKQKITKTELNTLLFFSALFSVLLATSYP